MNTETIGKAAGAIWKKLRESGSNGITFTDLKRTPAFTTDEVLAGIGWLAREGKLSFKETGKKLVVTLVDQEILVTA